MTEALLVINAGSSSLKFALYQTTDGEPARLARGQVAGLPKAPHFAAVDADEATLTDETLASCDHAGALDHLFGWIESRFPGVTVIAAGHRVVHGGRAFAAPVRIDEERLSRLEALCPLAPLHQPHNLAPIRALAARPGGMPQVACFDTAFHRDNDRLAQLFALPRRYAEAGVIRYGFHGLSYEYIARSLAEVSPRAAEGRTVVAHLGNGASLCALKAGRSIATTMGFTALDGLPMGTRTGSLDPGVVLYLMQEEGLSAAEIETLLYRQSGLLGLSGLSHDMRTLLEAGTPEAEEAVAFYCYRIAREIGSLMAALDGLDALVFTAGIGENAAPVRARVLAHLGWTGASLDDSANTAGERRISTPDSAIDLMVLPTNEELMIARHTLEVLNGN